MSRTQVVLSFSTRAPRNTELPRRINRELLGKFRCENSEGFLFHRSLTVFFVNVNLATLCWVVPTVVGKWKLRFGNSELYNISSAYCKSMGFEARERYFISRIIYLRAIRKVYEKVGDLFC